MRTSVRIFLYLGCTDGQKEKQKKPFIHIDLQVIDLKLLTSKVMDIKSQT